jgi:hypothetical protein
VFAWWIMGRLCQNAGEECQFDPKDTDRFALQGALLTFLTCLFIRSTVFSDGSFFERVQALGESLLAGYCRTVSPK